MDLRATGSVRWWSYDVFANHLANIQTTFDAAKCKIDWALICDHFLNRLAVEIQSKVSGCEWLLDVQIKCHSYNPIDARTASYIDSRN
jgi:hypothetical protein